MRLLSLLVFSLMMVVGCSVKRITDRTIDSTHDIDMTMERMTMSTGIMLHSENKDQTLTRNFVLVHRVFDLDRERDSTGKYPVKEEYRLEGNEAETRRDVDSSFHWYDSTVKDSTYMRRHEVYSGKEVLSTHVDGRLDLWIWILVGVALSVLVLIFLRYRNS